MPSKERLFLLDGMALAYRAYFAFISRPLINSKGENTSAIFGFANTLLKILEDEKPDHIAVVFDTKEPTFRHDRYPAYKATRQKMPEDMASQLEKLKEVVRAFNTPLLEVPGYEADDVIGTLARRAEKEGIVTYMVTGDKDFMQLISPHIKMYKPGKAGSEIEIVEEEGVFEKFGVTPDKVVEVLGLIGDKSDNVPGVPGIGEKTAIPLIQKYGSIENLYRHVEEVSQKGVRSKLIENKDKAFLSKELVTINTNVPVPIDFHKLPAMGQDTSKLVSLFSELEFKSLLTKLRETGVPSQREASVTPADVSMEFPPAEMTSIATDEHVYTCITTQAALDQLCSRLKEEGVFVFDTETTSVDAMRARLIGLSFCTKEREAFYVPVRNGSTGNESPGELFQGGKDVAHADDHTDSALNISTVLQRLKPILENPLIRKVGQNLKYDVLRCRRDRLRHNGGQLRPPYGQTAQS